MEDIHAGCKAKGTILEMDLKKKEYLSAEGLALVTILMIVVVSAGLVVTLLYFTQTGTEISGFQRKYETSREATIGGIDVLTKEILPAALAVQTAGGGPFQLQSYLQNNFTVVGGLAGVSSQATDDPCFASKLGNASASWNAACNRSPDPTISPDMQFVLQAANGGQYRVRVKIIDSARRGNSDTTNSDVQTACSVSDPNCTSTSVVHFPYLYTIETQGEKATNPYERAKLEALYAY